MTRLYGRSLAGQRLLDSVSGSQWNTTTMISAIRLESVVTAMVTAIGKALNAVTPEVAVGWFAHEGYGTGKC